jgi:excisionase family DNA binding protein
MKPAAQLLKVANPEKTRLSYKIKEAAELIGVSQATIRRAIQRGLLKPCRAFRHPLIPAEQLQELVAGR